MDSLKNPHLHKTDVCGSAWINILEKTPKVGEYVLGYRPFANEVGDEEFTVLKYNGYEKFDYKGNIHSFDRCHYVSHWQPLIKPQ